MADPDLTPESAARISPLIRWPLRYTIPGLLLIIVLLGGILSYAQQLQVGTAQVLHEESSELRARLALEAEQLSALLLRGAHINVEEHVAAFANDPRIEYAVLVDDSNRVLASTRLAEIATVIDLGPTLPAALRNQASGTNVVRVHERDLIALGAVRLTSKFETVARYGQLFIREDLSARLAAEKRRVQRQLRDYLLYFSFIAVLLWGYFEWAIGRRLRHVSQAIIRVAHGERGVRLTTDGHDEIAQLINAANTGAAWLDDVRDSESRLIQALERLSYFEPGADPFIAIAEAVARGLRCRWAGVSRTVPGARQLETLGVYGPDLTQGIRYELAGTPCEAATLPLDGVTIVTDNVRQLYPASTVCAALGAASYRGAGIFDANGRLLGTVYGIDPEPCANSAAERALLKSAANRAGHELMRRDVAAKALEHQQTLELALTASSLGFLDWQLDTKRIVLNARWAQMLGYEPDELAATLDAWEGLIHPDDLESARYLRDSHLKGLVGASTIEYRLRTKCGYWRWILARAQVVKNDPGGAAQRLLIMHLDIHDAKAAAVSLRERERYLQLMIDASQIGTWEWNAEANRTLFGPEWARLMGFPADQLPATYAAQLALVHPDDRVHMLSCFEAHRIGETPDYRCEFRVLDGLGRWRWVLDKGQSVEHNDDRTARRMLGIQQDITHLKDVELQLRDRTEFLEAAVRGSMDGLWNWDLVSDQLYVSPRVHELLGYEEGEIPSDYWSFVRLTHLEQDSVVRDDFVQRARQSDFLSWDQRLRTKHGTLLWFHLRCMVVRGDDGEPRRFVGSASDINDRKQRAAELAQTQKFLSEILDNIDGAVVRLDAEDRIIFVNRQYRTFTGVDPERQLTGTPFSALVRELCLKYPDHLEGGSLEEVVAQRVDHLKNLEPYEVRIDDRWFFVQNRPTADGGSIGFRTEITTLKSTERALRASQARLNTLLDNSAFGIFLCDERGTLLYVNRLFRVITGLSDELPALEQCYAHISPQARDALRARWLAFVAAPASTFEAEYESIVGDAGVRRLFVNSSPIFEAGRCTGFVGTLEDVTSQRAAENEREMLLSQIRQTQKMEALGQLTGGVAHDFNNVLASVLGYTKLGEMHQLTRKDPKLTEYFAAIRQASERARDLVGKMLAFSRYKPANALEVVSPQGVVQEAVKFLKPLIPSSIALLTKFDTQVASVFADSGDLHQAIINLAINARDACHGQGQIEFSVAAGKVDAQCSSCKAHVAEYLIEITIADTGSGIAPEYLDRLFEPFFTTKEVGYGTGLGLAVTHAVVHRAGGHIVVDPNYPLGTRVKLLLRPATPAPLEHDAFRRGQQSAKRIHQDATVIVVDDDTLIVAMLNEYLLGQQYQVRCFSDSHQALMWMKGHAEEIDVLVSDQTMPGLTGTDLIKCVREAIPNLPVILCTGFSDSVDESNSRALGVDYFLRKPLELEALSSAIDAVLARRSIHQENS